MGVRRRGVLALAWLLLAMALPSAGVAQAQQLAAPPNVSAAAAYVFDASANVELLALNSTEQRAPASTVKIVTAMVVLDHADLTTEIVFDEADTASADESRMGLQAGDTVTVQQLLTGL